MSRSQQKKVVNQGLDLSKKYSGQADTQLAQTNAELGNYKNNLAGFMKSGRDTYGRNGEYIRTQNTLGNTVAAAGANQLSGDLALNAARTGANTANYAPTVAESGRQSSRDLTQFLASANADRLKNLTAINQYGVEAGKFPVQVQSSLYAPAAGESVAALNPSANAAQTPSFMDALGNSFASNLGRTAGGGNISASISR